MNKNSLTHGFFAGKVTIKTYNAYDSIEVLRYCINRGLDSFISEESIIGHFEGHRGKALFFVISLRDNMLNISSSYWECLDSTLSIYDSNMFNIPSFKL